jgi:hypothetical protein
VTHRWREPDSNHRSRRERNGNGRAPKSILAISDLTLSGGSTDRADVPIGNAQQSLLQQRDRWFESGFLQRRVFSLPELLRGSRTPAFRAAVRGGLATGSAETCRCYEIAPTGGNISVAPYSSTAVPLMGSRMPRRFQIKSGRSPGLIVGWISALGPGSTKAQHDPLIVPGKRQA